MKQYKNWSPTQFDTKGLNCDDRQEWYVCPVIVTRDSGPLATSNFKYTENKLAKIDPDGKDHEVHRFGHWANGWFEILIVRPNTACYELAVSIENSLADYPILDEMDYSDRECEEADRVWKECFSVKERIAYIRKDRRQFDFTSFKDMLACVRGKFFCGYASELIEG